MTVAKEKREKHERLRKLTGHYDTIDSAEFFYKPEGHACKRQRSKNSKEEEHILPLGALAPRAMYFL